MHPILNIKIEEFSEKTRGYWAMILSWESYLFLKDERKDFHAEIAFKNFKQNARYFYGHYPIQGFFPKEDRKDIALLAIIEAADKWLLSPTRDNAKIFTRITYHALPEQATQSNEIAPIDEFIEKIQLDLF